MERNTNQEIVNDSEFEAAKTEALVSAGSYTYNFAKPWEYEGKTYQTLTFDWDKLTGNDSLAIEAELQTMGRALIAPEFSGDYLVRMAARACTTRIGCDVIQAMPISAFNTIRNKARSFLLRSGL